MNHYLIGVGIKGIRSDKSGEKELDFFFSYTDKDVEKAKLARDIKKNEMWKISDQEAIKLVGASMTNELSMISIRAHVHELLVCLYTSDCELDRGFFKTFVEHTSIEDLKKAEVML